MKATISKALCMAVFSLTLLGNIGQQSNTALAVTGGAGPGGGDHTEIEVNRIRADILQWINEGRSRDLKLPEGLAHQQYVEAMRGVLKPLFVTVSFVTTEQENETTDPEQKVIVDGVRKTCRGFYSVKDDRPHILCNSDRYPSEPQKQYRLIHHEYAIFAGVELNQGAASDYFVSDQISNKLGPDLEYRLCPSNSRSSLGNLKQLFWINFRAQPNLVLASLEEQDCEGKMLLMDPTSNSVVAEASGTVFTTTPSGQALCGENAYIHDHVSIQSYDVTPPASGPGEVTYQLLMTINESSNYRQPSTTVGDLFLISRGENGFGKPRVIAKCSDCSAQIESELKRVLTQEKFAMYSSLHPQHRFSKNLVAKVVGTPGSPEFSATMRADLDGIGSWRDPQILKVTAKMTIETVGSDLKIKIESAKLSGELNKRKSQNQ